MKSLVFLNFLASHMGLPRALGSPLHRHICALHLRCDNPLSMYKVYAVVLCLMCACLCRRSFNATSLGPICPQHSHSFDKGLPQSEGANLASFESSPSCPLTLLPSCSLVLLPTYPHPQPHRQNAALNICIDFGRI